MNKIHLLNKIYSCKNIGNLNNSMEWVEEDDVSQTGGFFSFLIFSQCHCLSWKFSCVRVRSPGEQRYVSCGQCRFQSHCPWGRLCLCGRVFLQKNPGLIHARGLSGASGWTPGRAGRRCVLWYVSPHRVASADCGRNLQSHRQLYQRPQKSLLPGHCTLWRAAWLWWQNDPAAWCLHHLWPFQISQRKAVRSAGFHHRYPVSLIAKEGSVY